jgi:hypothetical protein
LDESPSNNVTIALALAGSLGLAYVLLAMRRRRAAQRDAELAEEELYDAEAVPVITPMLVRAPVTKAAIQPASQTEPAVRPIQTTAPAVQPASVELPREVAPAPAPQMPEPEPAPLDRVELPLPRLMESGTPSPAPFPPLHEVELPEPPSIEMAVFDMASPAPAMPAGDRAAQQEYLAGRHGAGFGDTIILNNPASVVERARVHYLEDGDTMKAVDLLELSVALNPDMQQPWLALFALYRRESLVRPYEKLAQRFHTRFPDDAHWPTVQQLGWEIDPDNLQYATATALTMPDDSSDSVRQDVTDEWLGVPLDFTGFLLAGELHQRLVGSAAAPARARSAGN